MLRYLRNAAIAFVLVSSGSAAAFADVLASGPVYDKRQNQVTCEIFNAGGVAITIANKVIFTNTGAGAPIQFNSCGATLGPRRSCFFGTNTVSTLSNHSCWLSIAGSVAAVRGTAQARINPQGIVLSEAPMR